MKNVEVTVEGDILLIQVDLSQEHGLSSSQKTKIVATSSGNQPVEGHEGIFMGLNVYKKA